MDRSDRQGRFSIGDSPENPQREFVGESPEILGLSRAVEGARASLSVEAGPPSRGLFPEPRRSRKLSRRNTLLVHPSGMSRLHPERLRALRLGVPQSSPTEWLAREHLQRVGVVVVGGRRATVAAAMIGQVLSEAGADPDLILRHPATATVARSQSRSGTGTPLVTDWPSDPASLQVVSPRILLLMDLPTDPTVDPETWRSELLRYIPTNPERQRLLILGDPRWGGGDRVSGDWLGFEPGSDWRGADLRLEPETGRFRIFERGEFAGEVRIRRRGATDVESALGAYAVCRSLGLSSTRIRAGLEAFVGLHRDFERRGSYRGVTLFDDSSETPRAIGSVVQRAREWSGHRRLWVILAYPILWEDGESGNPLRSLAEADRVILFHSRDRAGCPAEELSSGGRFRNVTGLAEVISALDEELEPGDVLLTIGSGEVGTIADALLRRLPRVRQAG